jgi:hypothetical protein
MGFLQNLLGGGAEKLVDSVGNVLDNVITTKEEKLALENEMKKAEMQFSLEMKKLSVEEERLGYEDLASARDREAKIQTSEYGTWLGKNVTSILALGTTVLIMVIFYFIVFRPDRYEKLQNGKDIVLYIMGVLSAIITQIYSYYFGSSRGSGMKAETIEKMKSQIK